jgi:hypothetical protein
VKYGIDISAYITRAWNEIEIKSLKDVQRETALVWMGRACAASMQLGVVSPDTVEYAHEAIEHAALCGDDTVLRVVRESLADHGIVV